jgi:hypothetical protein
MQPGISHKPFWLVLAALLGAAGVWLYAQRVLIRYQIADAAAHDRPRGNLSDLYPRWLGARELLLHRRDPYSPALTREIQEGYYGRTLDPARPGDPKDQQGFAYPIYIVFCLAPTIHLPFEMVRKGFFWVLLGLTIAAVPLWLRVLRWQVPLWAEASIVILTIGSLPVMQGLKLQQMTLLVVALLAVAIALLVSDRPIAAGIVLAWATIKPQLLWLVLLWLTIWTLADWRRRHRWAASFLATMAVLLVGSEWYLPHWTARFLQAVREYRNYTDAVSVLDKLVSPSLGWLPAMISAALAVHACWRQRRCPQGTPAFAINASLVLAVTVIVIPSYALYNQIMLLPALLLLVRERHRIWHRNLMTRVLLSVVAILLVWPWLASVVLAALSFVLPLELVERAWAVPGWTVLSLPVGVAALMLDASYQRSFAALPEPVTS